MLSGDVRRAAVLGSPIGHSLSPTLHRTAYGLLQLVGWSYETHQVEQSELAAFVSALGPEWAGLSLTMPLKEVAFEVADDVSDLARAVGAINTLVRRPDGGWSGHNTDVHGVSQALREAGRDHVPSALVLGSGATARAALAALAALGCTKITFAVRSQARPQTLDQARRAGLAVDVIDLADVGRVSNRMREVPVVVSTLPAGVSTADVTGALVALGGLRRTDHLLLDVVYAGWPTPLARAFGQAGATVVSGVEMLVHQAAEQVHLMTGRLAPVDEMRAAALAEMVSR